MSTISEAIQKVQAGIAAVAEEDSSTLSDAALAEQFGQLAVIWDQLDACVTRMANTVIARTFAVSEVGTTA
jgi:hypothetical protein